MIPAIPPLMILGTMENSRLGATLGAALDAATAAEEALTPDPDMMSEVSFPQSVGVESQDDNFLQLLSSLKLSMAESSKPVFLIAVYF